MEPRIIYKTAFSVIGIWKNGNPSSSSLDAVWERLGERYAEIPCADPDEGYGVHLKAGSGDNYLAGLAVRSRCTAGNVPPGMSKLDLEAHAYAVFHHRGRLENLECTLHEIFSNWLPDSGYQAVADYFFEYYDDRFQPNTDDSLLFVYVPIVEAGRE
jgi:AraC family transcriptional regulator